MLRHKTSLFCLDLIQPVLQKLDKMVGIGTETGNKHM